MIWTALLAVVKWLLAAPFLFFFFLFVPEPLMNRLPKLPRFLGCWAGWHDLEVVHPFDTFAKCRDCGTKVRRWYP